MQMWRGEGRDVLRELGDGLDELHRQTPTAPTARRPWLQAWIHCYPAYHPVALAVGNGSWEAVALLGVRRVRGLDRIFACGHGPSDAVTMPAVDEERAGLLAETLLGDLRARPRW